MIREIVSRLLELGRNGVTDPRSRGSDATETFTADGTTSAFDLSNKRLKNISYVKVGGTEQVQFDDFRKVYDNPTDSTDSPQIIFREAPSQDIEAKYHYGQTWLYPGYPQSEATFPRISLQEITSVSENKYLGRKNNSNQQVISTDNTFAYEIWAKKDESFTISDDYYPAAKLLDYLTDELVNHIENKRSTLKEQQFRDSTWNVRGRIKDITLNEVRSLDMSESEYFRQYIEYSLLTEEVIQ